MSFSDGLTSDPGESSNTPIHVMLQILESALAWWVSLVQFP